MSIATVEIRSFSGPDLVELGSANRPAIVRLNVGPKGDDGATGPAGPNSVTSATTSDGTAVLSVAEVVATASGNRIVGIYASDEEGRSGSLQFSDGVNSVGIIMAENSPTADLVLPSSSGTIALTSDIPTDVNNITSATTSDGTADLQVASLSVFPNGQLALASSNSGGVVVQNGQQATDARIIAFPDASGTVALTSQTVLKSDYTPAHSILAQQSGTGSPTAVTLGNNTILGRMSGGGSAIAGLSASDARTVMGLGTLATVNGGTGVADFLASPTSANLAAAVTGETGTGSLVFATSPTITTPAFTRSGTGNIFTGGDGTRTITSLIASYGVEMAISAATGTEGAYLKGIGNLEAWAYVTAQSNTSGLRVMRFGNRTNRFSIQRLTDNEASITATPFSIANNAPSDSFYMESGGGIGLGTATPSTRAVLDLTSTTRGFLPPRMTTAQRDAITSVPAGLMIYNTSTNKLNFYNGTAWEVIVSL
jgi:hypothetical protein